MNEWFITAVRDAVTSTLGWAGIIVGTLIIGFCAGYWIGHWEVTGADQTLAAFAWLPVLWLGFSQMFVAYAVTALAWYLPMRYESGWLRIVAASANLVIWLVVVESIVKQSAHTKFFHY